MVAPLAEEEADRLPHCETAQAWIDQVTPWPAGSLFTVAMIFGKTSANFRVAEGGVMSTEMASTVIVMEVAAAGSATEVAVTVTGKSAGGGAVGAV